MCATVVHDLTGQPVAGALPPEGHGGGSGSGGAQGLQALLLLYACNCRCCGGEGLAGLAVSGTLTAVRAFQILCWGARCVVFQLINWFFLCGCGCCLWVCGGLLQAPAAPVPGNAGGVSWAASTSCSLGGLALYPSLYKSPKGAAAQLHAGVCCWHVGLDGTATALCRLRAALCVH